MPKETFLNLPQEKRDRIFDAAMRAFAETHYKKVTIDKIVEYASIPKGSFYQYFSNKDDLFKYLFEKIGSAKKQLLEEVILQSQTMTFKELMLDMTVKANSFETKDEFMIKMKDKFLIECPQDVKNDIMLGFLPDTYKLYEKVIEIYIKKGEFRENLNIKDAAYIIVSCLMSLENYEGIKKENYGEILIRIFDLMVEGFKN